MEYELATLQKELFSGCDRHHGTTHNALFGILGTWVHYTIAFYRMTA